MPAILSSVSYILLMMLVSVVPVRLPRFPIPRIPCIYFLYCFHFHYQVLNSFIHFLYSFIYLFVCVLGFLEGIY